VSSIVKKSLIPIFSLTFVLNLILFFIKLYIGLSSNSISIYSDGINNLFDAFSCMAVIVCFYFLNKSREHFSRTLSAKTEHLVSLALSCMLFGVGFVFLYNSAERLMYPTPVWFTMTYFFMLLFSAAVKLGMFFLLKHKASRLDSKVIRLMSVDSLTDFFITAVTVLTLLISQMGSYSFDALGGIAISILVIVTAIKNLKQSTALLLGVPEKEKRKKIERLIDEALQGESYETEFSFAREEGFI